MTTATNASHRNFSIQAVLGLIGVILLNPSLYALILGQSFGAFYPDSAEYLQLAKQLLSDGSLVLQGWNHIDTVSIRPPLYSLFIAAFDLIRNDSLGNATIISHLATLGSGALVYLFLCRRLSTPLALVASAVSVLNYQLQSFGGAGLSDPLFVFFVLLTLVATDRFRTSSPWICALVGIAAGLCFLTRQIGAVTVVAAMFSLLLPAADQPLSARFARALVAATAFSCVSAMYVIPLYLQTGHLPIVQTYRSGNYEVHAGQSSTTAKQRDDDYLSIFKERRKTFHLNAAGSEMLAYEVGAPGATSPPLQRIGHTIRAWPSHLFLNLKLLITANGWAFAALSLFGLAAATIAFRRDGSSHEKDLLIFAAVYLASLTLFSWTIQRYLLPLYPIGICLGYLQLSRLMKFAGFEDRRSEFAGALLLAVLLAVTAGQNVFSLKASPRSDERIIRAVPCLNSIPPGSPAYSFTPMDAYALQAIPRIVPNDSLERIVAYAHQTGVSWLILRDDAVTSEIGSMYGHADWFKTRFALQTLNPAFVPVCHSRAIEIYVYRIS